MFVEMESGFGLKGYAKEVFALNRIGLSGKSSDVINSLGFIKENVAQAFKKILN